MPSGRLKAEALYEHALRLLGRRAHTRVELEIKLRRRSATRKGVAKVVDRLERHGYVDDTAVAEAYSVMRRDSALMGPRRVLDELRRRGVDELTAENAVASAYGGREEVDFARALLRRKLGAEPGNGEVNDPKRMARLFRALARAGFGPNTIADALRDVCSDTELLDGLVESSA